MGETNTTDKKHEIIENQVLEVIQVQWEQHEETREILSIFREKIQMDLNALGYIEKIKIPFLK